MVYKKECINCGKKIITKKSYKKFCSKECRKEKMHDDYGIYKNYPEKKCKTCGLIFKPKYIHHIYCSKECSKKPRKMLELHKPIIREYFLEKVNFTCEECKKSEINLHLHHIIPIYKGGNDIENNIIVLCINCHRKKHKLLN